MPDQMPEPWPHKRLSSDASIVLRNAGFPSTHIEFRYGKPQTLAVQVAKGDVRRLEIRYGCVNNEVVEAILKGKPNV